MPVTSRLIRMIRKLRQINKKNIPQTQICGKNLSSIWQSVVNDRKSRQNLYTSDTLQAAKSGKIERKSYLIETLRSMSPKYFWQLAKIRQKSKIATIFISQYRLVEKNSFFMGRYNLTLKFIKKRVSFQDFLKIKIDPVQKFSIKIKVWKQYLNFFLAQITLEKEPRAEGSSGTKNSAPAPRNPERSCSTEYDSEAIIFNLSRNQCWLRNLLN